uniref:hypothetical protein n=1 Tax=Neisseria meningitidis TaxID=487 RepID=UPI00195963E2
PHTSNPPSPRHSIPPSPTNGKSSFFTFSNFQKIALALKFQIPACAGMTGFEVAAFIGKNRKPKTET